MARLSEEITDSGLLGMVVEYLADPACHMAAGHSIDVVVFCAEQVAWLFSCLELMPGAYLQSRACLR